MALQNKSVKGMSPESKDSKDNMSESSVNGNINAPKYGTVIPNRIFVGGISPSTTETDLSQLFSNYGNVRNSKIIFDRGGVSKGYGFVTFETEDEAKRLKDADNIVLRDRKLNIAPAIMKQQAFTRTAYDGGHPPASPHPPSQAYHQNGVPYTYLNGTAFFSPNGTQSGCVSSVSSNSVEPIFNPAPYSIMQSSPSTGFPSYPCVYQGQIYYPPTAYQQYPISHFDGCYQIGEPQGGQLMVQPNCENNVVMPPVHYYCPVPPYPQQDISFMPPFMHQITVHQDPNTHQPIVYSSQRHYEQPTAVAISEASPFRACATRTNCNSLAPTCSGNPASAQRRCTKTKNGSKGGRNSKWASGESSVECPSDGGVVVPTLTPPITPRSNQEDEQSPPSPTTHEVDQSLRALKL